MKKTNKFIYVILVIAIIAVLILSYLLITRNAIIERQAEQIELQAMETNGSNSYMTTKEHLDESEKVYEVSIPMNQMQVTGFTPKTTAYVSLGKADSSIFFRFEIPSEATSAGRMKSVEFSFYGSDSDTSTEYNGYRVRVANGSTYRYCLPRLKAELFTIGEAGVDYRHNEVKNDPRWLEGFKLGKLIWSESARYNYHQYDAFWEYYTKSVSEMTANIARFDTIYNSPTYNNSFSIPVINTQGIWFAAKYNGKIMVQFLTPSFAIRGYPVFNLRIVYK